MKMIMLKKIYQNKGDNMTVRELINEIVNTCESFDQEVILFSLIGMDEAYGAMERDKLTISINGDCLQLFMR